MRIYESHLVFESDRDSLNHVLDVGCDSSDASNVLSASVPNFNSKLLLVDKGQLHSDMVEVFGQSSSWSSNSDDSSLDLHLYIRRDLDVLLLTNEFHLTFGLKRKSRGLLNESQT